VIQYCDDVCVSFQDVAYDGAPVFVCSTPSPAFNDTDAVLVQVLEPVAVEEEDFDARCSGRDLLKLCQSFFDDAVFDFVAGHVVPAQLFVARRDASDRLHSDVSKERVLLPILLRSLSPWGSLAVHPAFVAFLPCRNVLAPRFLR